MIDRHQMLDDFVETVAEMRAHQKRYFASRWQSRQRQNALDAAITTERKVDAMLRQLRAAEKAEQQPELNL